LPQPVEEVIEVRTRVRPGGQACIGVIATVNRTIDSCNQVGQPRDLAHAMQTTYRVLEVRHPPEGNGIVHGYSRYQDLYGIDAGELCIDEPGCCGQWAGVAERMDDVSFDSDPGDADG